MLIPLYGFLEGDCMGLLVLAHDHESMARIAEKLQSAAKLRVQRIPDFKVIHRGKALPLHKTLAECGITALERIDVVAHGVSDAN